MYMRVHFIAIGGAAMHNLAIALQEKGYHVTGSDDEIFDPARTHLQQYGLLPEAEGWHPERITAELDAVVLGMHARADNPELLRAQEMGIKIYSYPEYLYEQSKDKVRVVIGGSHGKTTTTAMILHAMRQLGIEADYMVGAQLKGFDVMVRLSDTAKVMVIEGDEYLTSPIDRRSKFLHYHPHIAVITGIAWDHINVFPTFESYVDTFRQFITTIMPEGALIYSSEDPQAVALAEQSQRQDLLRLPYQAAQHTPQLKIFGHHNMLNYSAAQLVCQQLGIQPEAFAEAMQSFEGAAKRLELVKSTDDVAIYKDFAHAPSKVSATIAAMREQYPDRRLVAALELHTFSSLTADFLHQYQDTMALADQALVYYSHHALQLKHLPELSPELVRRAFGGSNVQVFTSSKELCAALLAMRPWRGQNLLLMSSGNFDGIDINQLATSIAG